MKQYGDKALEGWYGQNQILICPTEISIVSTLIICKFDILLQDFSELYSMLNKQDPSNDFVTEYEDNQVELN